MARRAFYILVVLLTSVFILGGTVAINAFVDPYRIIGFVDRQGFNRYKPAIYNRVRLLKAYEVRNIRPDSVLLGTSRCHVAFRPSHPLWKQHSIRPYNLAFDGATTKEMYRYLVHAHSVQPLKLVLLGLDTYHPTRAPGSARADFDPLLLADGPGFSKSLRLAFADFKIMTSFDTVLNSIKTLRAQNVEEPVWLASDGQRLGEAFFRRPQENFEKFGPRYYFDEINKMEVGFKLDWRIPRPAIKVYPPKEQSQDSLTSLEYIAKIVEFCRKERIQLKIFFTPSHVLQMELDKLLGQWPATSQGKRDLVNFLAKDAQEHPDQLPVELYDFSGYSRFTTEPLPPPGSRDEMAYYWDSSHFKQSLGDEVLQRLLGSHPDSPEDFGVVLTPSNIEEVLRKQEADSLAYGRTYAGEIRQLQKFVEDFKAAHNLN